MADDQQVLNSNDVALAGIYNDLANQLEQSRGTTQGIFQQGSQAVGQDYQAAQDAAQAGGSASLGSLAASAGRLGIGGAGLDQASGNLKGTLGSFLSGLNTMRAAKTSALDTTGTYQQIADEQRKVAANAAGAQARSQGRISLQNQLTKGHAQEAAAKSQLSLEQLKLQLALAQAKAKSSGLTPYEAASLGLRQNADDRQARMDALRATIMGQQIGSGTSTMRSQAQINALNQIDQGLGGVGTHGAAIVNEIIGSSKNYGDALNALGALQGAAGQGHTTATSPNGVSVSLVTPNGNPMNWGALASYIGQYYQAPGEGLDALGLALGG